MASFRSSVNHRTRLRGLLLDEHELFGQRLPFGAPELGFARALRAAEDEVRSTITGHIDLLTAPELANIVADWIRQWDADERG